MCDSKKLTMIWRFIAGKYLMTENKFIINIIHIIWHITVVFGSLGDCGNGVNLIVPSSILVIVMSTHLVRSMKKKIIEWNNNILINK